MMSKFKQGDRKELVIGDGTYAYFGTGAEAQLAGAQARIVELTNENKALRKKLESKPTCSNCVSCQIVRSVNREQGCCRNPEAEYDLVDMSFCCSRHVGI
mgnify:CR=1 FL=1